MITLGLVLILIFISIELPHTINGVLLIEPHVRAFSFHNSKYALLRNLRGGSLNKDEDESSDYYDEELEEDDDLFDMESMSIDTNEDDFNEESTLDRLWFHWQKTPPMTKAYITASLALTGMGYVTNKNEFPKIFLLDWKSTFLLMQLWRPFTAFLNFGPFGIGYVLTLQFLWTYMSTLESLCYNKPYDFWIMILFGCASMVVGYSVLKLPPRFLGHNLSTFLVYVWSRYHEGFEVNVMELFNTRAELLPWFFLAQTALFEGEFPVLDLLGIAFGHIYHHLKVANIIRTPAFIIKWYNSDSVYSNLIRDKYKEISSDFELQL